MKYIIIAGVVNSIAIIILSCMGLWLNDSMLEMSKRIKCLEWGHIYVGGEFCADK